MTGSSPKLTTAREVEIYSFAEKVYHIHLRLKGDIDEVYFKNYLIDNPDIAKEYEELKIMLWKNESLFVGFFVNSALKTA